MWRTAANIVNNQLWTANGGTSSSLQMSEGLATPHHEEPACYEMLHRASELVGCCEHGNEPLGSVTDMKYD